MKNNLQVSTENFKKVGKTFNFKLSFKKLNFLNNF